MDDRILTIINSVYSITWRQKKRKREKKEMKYIVKITKWNQIKIHEFINFFFPPQRKDINDFALRVINDTSRLLPIKGDPIITLITKGNVSRTIGL